MATRNILSSTLDDMLPLLRSIQAEINDRLGAIETLERRMQAFLPTRHVHEVEVARIDAELSTHRRELRLISKELSRLGVAFDAEHPHQNPPRTCVRHPMGWGGCGCIRHTFGGRSRSRSSGRRSVRITDRRSRRTQADCMVPSAGGRLAQDAGKPFAVVGNFHALARRT